MRNYLSKIEWWFLINNFNYIYTTVIKLTLIFLMRKSTQSMYQPSSKVLQNGNSKFGSYVAGTSLIKSTINQRIN